MSIILIIVVAIIAIAILSFLVKSLIKVALIVGLIYLLFQIGFVWGGDEMKEKLHLDKWLDSNVSEQVEDGYQSFSKKRDELATVNTDAIKSTVESELQKALAKASNEVKNVDKEKLLNDLSQSLKEFDMDSVEKALNDLGKQLEAYNLTPEQIEKATEVMKSESK